MNIVPNNKANHTNNKAGNHFNKEAVKGKYK